MKKYQLTSTKNIFKSIINKALQSLVMKLHVKKGLRNEFNAYVMII